MLRIVPRNVNIMDFTLPNRLYYITSKQGNYLGRPNLLNLNLEVKDRGKERSESHGGPDTPLLASDGRAPTELQELQTTPS